MRTKRSTSFVADRCNYTAQLRRRARVAEARLEPLRVERDEAFKERDAAFAVLQAERRALVAFLESPEWARDLLLMAREQVRADLTEQAATRQSCGTCGGLGRGLYDGLLTEAIETLTRESDLPPVEVAAPIDWPRRMGSATYKGRRMKEEWLKPPKAAAKKRRVVW